MSIKALFTHNESFDDKRAVCGVIGLSAIGNGGSVIQPMVVGGMIDTLGFSPSLAGYVIAAEMSAFAICSLLLFSRIHMFNRRIVAVIGGLTFIGANLASIFVESFFLMCTARALAGIGASLAMAVYWTTVAAMEKPERIFAFVQATAISYSGLFLFISPWILSNWGLPGAFMFLAASGLCAMIVVKWVPTRRVLTAASGEKSKPMSTRMLFVNSTAVLTLLCFLAMYVGHGAIWPFQERLGVFHGFDKDSIGKALGSSMLIWGVLGSGISMVQGLKFKNLFPLIVSFSLSILAALLLIFGTSYVLYSMASALVAFSWFYGLPYLKGIMAAIDREGRVLVAAGVVFPIGLALGPVMAASVVQHGGVVSVAWLGVFCYVVCLALIIVPAARVDGHLARKASSINS